MLKKIILGTLLVGLIAVLVAGAIIRTVDKTENVAAARGEGRGYGNSEERGYAIDGVQGLDADAQGNGRGGQGNGRGQGVANTERQYPNYEGEPEEWVTYSGTVAQAPAAGVDLVLETDDGEEIVIGTGPGYMETQGFALETGEQVQVQGYWEDDELKATQVTSLQDGQTIALRDTYGRPAWAGGGRWASEEAESVVRGGYDAEGNVDAPGDGIGTGQAQVDEWLEIQGTIVSIDSDALMVETSDGQEIVVDGRPWRFAQESGFWSEAGEDVTLVGFYENEEFEVGQISTGKATVLLRDENGRPGWAGRGRRGG